MTEDVGPACVVSHKNRSGGPWTPVTETGRTGTGEGPEFPGLGRSIFPLVEDVCIRWYEGPVLRLSVGDVSQGS